MSIINTHCYICLCVYKNEEGLPHVLKNIESIIHECVFHKVSILIYYDYDLLADTSLSILLAWKRKHIDSISVHIIAPTMTKEIHNTTHRTGRITWARNELLRYLRYDTTCSHFIMMDTNNYACVGEIRSYILRQILLRQDEWDSISFMRDDGYYDYFALRYGDYIYNFFMFPNYEMVKREMMDDFNSLFQMNENVLLPVMSSFNGFALYKWSIFKECYYDDKPYEINDELISRNELKTNSVLRKDLLPKWDCEHCYFHAMSISKYNAKIRFSPLSLFGNVKTDSIGKAKTKDNLLLRQTFFQFR